jgi:hypothetical protein
MSDVTFREALQDFQAHYEADRDNRDHAEEDNRFCASDQWDDVIRQARELDHRPVLTIDKTGQFVRQVSGDWRKASPTVEIIPDDDDASPEIAEIFDGMVRQIEYKSLAAQVYSWGLECAARCGIGHWRIGTRYADGDTFDQECYVERIPDPLSVTWDAAAIALDRSDAKTCYVSDMVPRAEFEQKYKGKLASDFPQDKDTSGLFWSRGDFVRVASRYWIEPKTHTIALLWDGRVVPVKDGTKPGGEIMRVRKVEVPCVYHQLMSGNDYLSDKEKLPGRYIPIVPVIGEEVAVDGRLIRRGIVRTLKDAQRLYNIALSANAEIIGSQPKAPYVGPLGSFQGLERYWNVANKVNLPYLPYNADANLPNGGRPERVTPPQGAPAVVDQLRLANEDMFSVTGIYPAALGQRSNETSGKAIEARQREADTGTFVYFDNANVAIKRTGDILVDLIQAVYDGQRQVSIMSREGEESKVDINKGISTPDGPAILNDITAGRYVAKIRPGPNYATAMEQAKEALAELMQNPQIAPVIGDLYVEHLDIPGGEKIAERLRRALPPQLLGEPQGPPDPMAEIVQRLQLQEAEAKTAKTQAEAYDKQQSGISKEIDNQAKAASLAAFGPEPPQHVQKAEDRMFQREEADRSRFAQTQESRESRAFNAFEAERGRQFSREERREVQASQPAE